MHKETSLAAVFMLCAGLLVTHTQMSSAFSLLSAQSPGKSKHGVIADADLLGSSLAALGEQRVRGGAVIRCEVLVETPRQSWRTSALACAWRGPLGRIWEQDGSAPNQSLVTRTWPGAGWSQDFQFAQRV